jgi:uncharacterized protein YdeI (YjbR/CyaY-like superfamily)
MLQDIRLDDTLNTLPTMQTITMKNGVCHTLPLDMKDFLCQKKELALFWNEITPLARNEWICFVISAKKAETREGRKDKMKNFLLSGRKRPCCFSGCPHRKSVC